MEKRQESKKILEAMAAEKVGGFVSQSGCLEYKKLWESNLKTQS